jgi:hypothetical protein
MALMNETARRHKGIALAAAAIFLVLSWTSVRRGQEGVWHGRCVDFWKKRQWIELKTLAQNLETAGRADAEALYFGMLAANQIRDSLGTKELGIKLLRSRALNIKMETKTATILTPRSAREYAALFRTRSVLLLWIALGALQLVNGIGRNYAPAWISIISVFGILILML